MMIKDKDIGVRLVYSRNKAVLLTITQHLTPQPELKKDGFNLKVDLWQVGVNIPYFEFHLESVENGIKTISRKMKDGLREELEKLGHNPKAKDFKHLFKGIKEIISQLKK